MVQRVSTVAFEGIEARAVDVQVQVAPGLPAFAIVGLPDKAVSEARERVRSALIASGLALPARRITVNLAPADLPKEGSHYDLPIALGLMAAIGAIPPDALTGFTVLGELGLDGSIAPVAGVLPAAIGANSRDEGLICPAACGAEAAWASPDIQIIAANSLIQIANHFKGTQVLSRPQPKVHEAQAALLDLRDIKGQESAKRALEIAAAGGHHLLMIGAPGAGKSMLAARLPSILPPLSPSELLEVSMIASVAGEIEGGALTVAAAVPQPASFRQHGGADRRRHARQARRDLAGASGRAVPRRIAGVRSARAGFAAPAAGERRGLGVPRQSPRHLSGALHAGRGDEPVPLRPCLRARLFLQARADRPLHLRLPDAHLRSADGPHRSAHRGAGGDRRRPDPAAAGGRLGRSRRPRRRGARHPARALCGRRPSARPHQCGSAGLGAGRDRAGPTRKARSCCATPPRPCGCRRAAITACCASRARWPISTAPRRSAGCISPKPCPTARCAEDVRRAA